MCHKTLALARQFFFFEMNLFELKEKLSGKTRDELVGLIFSLTSFDKLLSARQIAEASGMSKRDVLRDMKAGRFVDPILGRGFFCRASNSLRVSATAANAWRSSFFVPVDSGIPITGHKKEALPSILQSEEDARRKARNLGREMGLGGKKIAQKANDSSRRTVRELSPAFLAGNGAK